MAVAIEFANRRVVINGTVYILSVSSSPTTGVSTTAILNSHTMRPEYVSARRYVAPVWRPGAARWACQYWTRCSSRETVRVWRHHSRANRDSIEGLPEPPVSVFDPIDTCDI